MKPKRKIVTVELETGLNNNDLKNAIREAINVYNETPFRNSDINVIRVQVNLALVESIFQRSRNRSSRRRIGEGRSQRR
jgi:hypothetical protein